MDRLQEIKEKTKRYREALYNSPSDFNHNFSAMDDIKWLIQTIEQLQKDEEILLDENKRLSRKVRELRRKTSFRVYEENLALAQEIEKYKEMIKGNQHANR